ncbi:hypothetical protein N0V88_008025 [Collariella sp. IMI 366227]|nr:hypothetical protein N0V88_008025 [Collariella sp. IMI 366227]
MGQRLRWARQVTEALVQVNAQGQAGFYPDMKPDNIILRQTQKVGVTDAVLIDLEQRGGWFTWSPPEVAYLEYLEILVDNDGMPEGDLKNEITDELKIYYDDQDWSPEKSGQRNYHNARGGFSSPWLALLRKRQQDLHLWLWPDDVWLAVLTQFSFFVNGNAEALRSFFVTHTDKPELVFDARPPTL